MLGWVLAGARAATDRGLVRDPFLGWTVIHGHRLVVELCGRKLVDQFGGQGVADPEAGHSGYLQVVGY
jgi:hypothetical protein